MPEPRGPLVEWRKKKVEQLKGLERREFTVAGLEIREKDSDTWIISGFASVTDRYYEVGFYEERIVGGSFNRTLREAPDVQFLVNHTDLPLARTLSGTLQLEERTTPDADGRTGLWFDAEVDKLDPDAQRLERKIRRGDINAASFAFQVTAQTWNDDYTKRDIKGLSLHRGDVSVVNQGANPYATVSIRSQDAIAALRTHGSEALLAALTEWRDHTLMPMEQRAGKALSAATMEVLTQVLNLVAAADEAVDEAQPLLAELMGVPNPDDDTETDDASGDGEERASVQRQITDPADVRMAIRQVIREPGQDERRAEIIERAKALNVPGLIPDAWTTAGELAEDRAIGEQEKRETYNDTYVALQAVLEDMFEDSGFYWVWVQDFTDAEVIYCAGGDMFSAPYTLEPGGAVSIGEGTEVRPVTAYVPLDTGSETEVTEPRAVVIPDFTTRARQELDLLRLKDGRR